MTRFEELEADAMFEKLGYKKWMNHSDGEMQQNVFTTQDSPYIEYKQENDEEIEQIRFDLYSKNIWFLGLKKENNRYRQLPCPINMKELMAINTKVEELGWNNE